MIYFNDCSLPHNNLGRVYLYLGNEGERLVSESKWEEFLNNGKPLWGIATPIAYALSYGFEFEIIGVYDAEMKEIETIEERVRSWVEFIAKEAAAGKLKIICKQSQGD